MVTARPEHRKHTSDITIGGAKLNWVDAFYFCIVTLTTIGYGDIVPHTGAGKIFTIFYVPIGIGIIGFFANLMIRNAVLRRELRRSRKLD